MLEFFRAWSRKKPVSLLYVVKSEKGTDKIGQEKTRSALERSNLETNDWATLFDNGSEHAPGIRYLPYRSYFWMVFIRRRTVVLVGKRRIQEMAGIEGEYR
ncbi:hypothetical protein PV326_007914 [Microctonus aethiopoides]|nr:hypothetical protein PV326_007914 [Microctonus aethiopoides]